MKKWIVLMMGLSFATLGFSQTTKVKGVSMTNPNGSTIDTATNQTAEGPTLRVSGDYQVLTFVAEVTKISGTINGTIALQGANRAGAYATIGTATNLSDATANYQFKETDKGFEYYRVLVTAAASGSASVSYRVTMGGTLKK